MAEQNILNTRAARMLSWLSIVAIIAGAALRLYVYFQNRNLMVDELNIVRNIYERSWGGLFRPLNYEQYAPPLFLCILKIISLILGFSEKAMRLYPLLASIIALILLYKILTHQRMGHVSLMALTLFAFNAFIVRYSTDVKQFLPDSMVGLALIYLALKLPINDTRNRRFMLLWVTVGAIAILSSMISVFILAGVGFYYLLQLLKNKSKEKLVLLIIIGTFWTATFALYYYFILRLQIGSDYAQNWHQPYFLNTNFSDAGARQHSWNLLIDLMKLICGTDNTTSLWIGFGLLLLGIGYGISRAPGLLILCLAPLLCMIIGSAFHKFTLLPRICIFAVPISLIIITLGLKAILNFWPRLMWLPIAAITVLLIVAVKPTELLAHKLEVDELSTCVDFAQSRGVALKDIYMHEWVTPSLSYYAAIHPNKTKYQPYKQMHTLGDQTPIDSLKYVLIAEGREYAFIYYWIDDETLATHRKNIFSALTPLDSLVKPSYRVMVFKAR